MERINKLQETQVSFEHNQCEQKGCSGIAIYSSPKHKYMLLCQNWKITKHFKTKTINYQNPKDLSLIAIEVVTLLERISNISDKFDEGDEVDYISEQVKRYQQSASELQKEVTNLIDLEPKAYRKICNVLYSKIIEFKQELFESKMYHTFKELFALYQLTQVHDVSDSNTVLDQIQHLLGKN